jgi:GNAT superfamily N-acetyltransferase
VTLEEQALLALFDREQRCEVTYPGMFCEVTPAVIRMWPADPALGDGSVIYSQLTADSAEAAIAEQIAFFEALGLDFEWKTYTHDAPVDLPERLLRHGFEAEEPESVVVLDLAEAPEVLQSTPTGDIRRVDDPAGLTDVIAALTQVWGEGEAWLGPALAHEMRETPDRIQVYVAYVDRVPASVAWIRYHPGSQFASLWGGSTSPEYRGRGLYTALLAARAQEALARGCRFLTVDASPMSRPILEKLGFRLLTITQPFMWRRKTLQTGEE